MSVILQTMLAMGVDVSMKKGERASSLTWVGVKFNVRRRQPCPRLAGEVPDGGHDLAPKLGWQRNGPNQGRS